MCGGLSIHALERLRITVLLLGISAVLNILLVTGDLPRSCLVALALLTWRREVAMSAVHRTAAHLLVVVSRSHPQANSTDRSVVTGR